MQKQLAARVAIGEKGRRGTNAGLVGKGGSGWAGRKLRGTVFCLFTLASVSISRGNCSSRPDPRAPPNSKSLVCSWLLIT